MHGWRSKSIGLLMALTLAPVLAGASSGLSRAETKSSAPALGDGGLYVQPWFLQSFLDLREDLGEARQKGKRLVVIFEQKGCPYCRELHLVNFADRKITDYIRANFEVVQLDLWGSRKVTDFDGKELTEKQFAKKYKVRFTPTVLFFATQVPADKAGKDAEVARMPGYLPPKYFKLYFEYVKAEAFKNTKFRAYVKARLAAKPN